MIDRRTLLAGAVAGWTRSGFARSINAAALYDKAIVIDANLVPPINGLGVLPPPAAAAIRASGLTAIKADLDGADTFASVAAMISDYQSVIASNPGVLAQVREAADIRRCKERGALGIIFSFEKVGQLAGKIENIDHFGALGVRVMQLSYNQASPFASGALGPAERTGLTVLGREAVDRMNTLGITIDLSHADAQTTADVVAVSRSSPVITHAGCAAIYPHPRNKSDQVLRAVAARGGVIGIYDLPFLCSPARQPTVDDYAAHLFHALDVCGEDHVGIGSDAVLAGFDTSPANMRRYLAVVADRKARGIGAPGEERPPLVVGMNTPRRAERVAEALAAKRLPSRIIDKVLGANWLAAFKRTWAPA